MLYPTIFLLFFPVLLTAFLVFDQLVRLEHSAYRKHWEADGKPHGYFWIPTESKSYERLVVKVKKLARPKSANLRLAVLDARMDERRREGATVGFLAASLDAYMECGQRRHCFGIRISRPR